MRYAGGVPTDDPDILLYHICRTFGCLPSQIEEEDPRLIERMAYIDYVVESKIQSEMRNARNRAD